MAWTAPMTAVAGSVFTAAQFNTFVRDNLAETAPAKAQTPGAHIAVTGAGSIAERVPATAGITTSDTTTSTAYGDLAGGPGPSVTVTTGPYALYFVHADVTNSGVNISRMSCDISGASTIGPADNRGLRNGGDSAVGIMASAAVFETNLTPGSNTFKAVYKVTAGTGTFANRRIVVIPF